MVPVLLQSHGNEDQNCVKVDKAGTITYDCHDKYMNLNIFKYLFEKYMRWNNMMKFQPAHSPELGGRREDKLAASALREQNAGRNLPQKNRLLKVANSCDIIVGWPHLEAESPGSSSCGEERLSSLANRVGILPSSVEQNLPMPIPILPDYPGFSDWLRKTSWFILFVSLTNHRFYALKIHHFLPIASDSESLWTLVSLSRWFDCSPHEKECHGNHLWCSLKGWKKKTSYLIFFSFTEVLYINHIINNTLMHTCMCIYIYIYYTY